MPNCQATEYDNGQQVSCTETPAPGKDLCPAHEIDRHEFYAAEADAAEQARVGDAISAAWETDYLNGER